MYLNHKSNSFQAVPNICANISADFLWVVHGDHASIWHRYGDMAPQMLDAQTWIRKERKKEKRKRKGEGRKGKVEGKKEGKEEGEG